MEVQVFEEMDLPVVEAGGEAEFKADRVLFDPFQMLKPLSIVIDRNIAFLREANLGGRVREYKGSPSVEFTVTLRKRQYGIPISLYSYNTREIVDTKITDEEGKAKFRVKFDSPGTYRYLVFIGTSYTPLISELLGDRLNIKVYLMVVETKRISDRWARFQGRSINTRLPFYFWRYPGFNIGLAGWAKWVELVPVVEGQKIRYEIGVSAWCSTPEPYPSHERCCEYRKRTWWTARLYATDKPGTPKLIGEDRINISYHSVYYIRYGRIEHKGRCIADYDPRWKPALCGWEKGTTCSKM